MSAPVTLCKALVFSVLTTSVLSGCGSKGHDPAAPSRGAGSGASVFDVGAMSLGAIRTVRHGSLDAVPTVAHCALDTVDGKHVLVSTDVLAGSRLALRGWVVDHSLAVPKKIAVIFQGYDTYAVSTTTGGSRPDVAKSLGADGATDSGFSLSVDASRLPPDTYLIQLLLQQDGRSELCNTHKWLSILPAGTSELPAQSGSASSPPEPLE